MRILILQTDEKYSLFWKTVLGSNLDWNNVLYILWNISIREHNLIHTIHTNNPVYPSQLKNKILFLCHEKTQHTHPTTMAVLYNAQRIKAFVSVFSSLYNRRVYKVCIVCNGVRWNWYERMIKYHAIGK